jgi:hypothetical protein
MYDFYLFPEDAELACPLTSLTEGVEASCWIYHTDEGMIIT